MDTLNASSVKLLLTSIIFSLAFLFFGYSQVQALTTYTDTFYVSTPSLTTQCRDRSGCDTASTCWNSESPGVTNCGTPCPGGNPWTKYSYTSSNCFQNFYNPLTGEERCERAHVELGPVCSTGDKCIAGETGLRAGSCTCGQYGASDYKYCCTTQGSAEACTSAGVLQDPYPPPEGQCPGGYIIDGSRVRDSSCVPIVSCSLDTTISPNPYDKCGQTGGCTNNYAASHTVSITRNLCTDTTFTYSCTDQGIIPGQCTTPPPPPPPPPPIPGACTQDLITGALDQPCPNNSTTANPVPIKGRYWCIPGPSGCVNFSADPNQSFISVDGVRTFFSNIPGATIRPGEPFSANLTLTPASHTIYVHVEGSSSDRGRNAVTELPAGDSADRVNGGCGANQCAQRGITVSAPTQPPPQLNDASTCTAISVNNGNPVYAGKNYPAAVSIRNDGTSTWTWNQPNPYRLGAEDPRDNTVWGLARVDLPTSPISPAATAPFNFNVWAPQIPGLYSFNWQMVHEGIQWFGSRCYYNVNVSIPAPTVSLSADPPSGNTPLSSTLTWIITGTATSCSVSQSGGNTITAGSWSGTLTGSDITASTHTRGITLTNATSTTQTQTFNIYCSNQTGSSQTASTTVSVSPPGTPPGPTVSTSLSCIDAGYSGSGFTVSWSNTTNPGVNWVDIDNDIGFATPYYHEAVSSVTSTTAPNGFNANDGSGALSFNPSTTYHARTYDQRQNSQVRTFTTPLSCSAPAPAPAPPPPPPPPPPAGPVCGNGTCEAGETNASCPNDCPSSSSSTPWIQTTGGDVHSNTSINTPGGPR